MPAIADDRRPRKRVVPATGANRPRTYGVASIHHRSVPFVGLDHVVVIMWMPMIRGTINAESHSAERASSSTLWAQAPEDAEVSPARAFYGRHFEEAQTAITPRLQTHAFVREYLANVNTDMGRQGLLVCDGIGDKLEDGDLAPLRGIHRRSV